MINNDNKKRPDTPSNEHGPVHIKRQKSTLGIIRKMDFAKLRKSTVRTQGK